jgi:hypothetical protein
LDLPFGPPPEVRGGMNSEQQRELARLLNTPKVMHKIRLTNKSNYPFTTAPALILREDRVLAQTTMTFTSQGAQVDLPITTALDFQVTRSEQESKRTPNGYKEGSDSYSRIDLAGKITITSHRDQANEIEVTRYVLGEVDSAGHDGTITKANLLEDTEFLGTGATPYWWNWFGWPYWWSHVNGVGRITWKITMAPKETVNLTYDWHYFWR